LVTSLLSTENSIDRAARRAADATLRLLALGDFRFTAAVIVVRVVKLPAGIVTAPEFRELRLKVGIFTSTAGIARAAET
jgi:hypothetical protein